MIKTVDLVLTLDCSGVNVPNLKWHLLNDVRMTFDLLIPLPEARCGSSFGLEHLAMAFQEHTTHRIHLRLEYELQGEIF
jgi:hypothetical protein